MLTEYASSGPIDYDKQCGVINDKGLPCSRSLTCKSHSMGAKRAVAGRSRNYDELLLDWQRQHNPNFVEPVKRETKKEKKEKRDKEREEKKRLMVEKKAAAALTGKKKKGATMPVKQGDEVEIFLEEDIDSEVELDAITSSVRAAIDTGQIAVPLATYGEMYTGNWFVERRERLRCCRDQIFGALMGGRGGVGAVPGTVPGMIRS
jgi:SAGA-associated factor 73